MRRKALTKGGLLTVAAAIAAILGGCNNAGEGAISGGLLGAGAGAAIGSLYGDVGKGAVIGAAGGLLGGAVLGDQNDRRTRSSGRGHSDW
ncbi:MAG: hypothetical protein H7Y88_03885 [Phycisphaerales bacterium]|nr:hypothetical protein [Phycisphaerales bacterium]